MVLQINLDDKEKLNLIGKALSSDVRIDILRLLSEKSFNVNEIADKLDIPASSAAMHVRALEEAGLIKCDLVPAVRGSMKLCSKAVNGVEIITESTIGADSVEVINMPIGAFVDYSVKPTCGIAGDKGPIGQEDEPGSFYHQDRGNAKLLWFGGDGFVEYRFPNYSFKEKEAKRVEFSLEACSEDHEFNMDFPSDITLWVNGKNIGTWTCPSDFGGRRGMWNPGWWPDKNTQYGVLKTWSLREDGCFIDGEKVSDLTLADVDLYKENFISVKIGVSENAKHKGGLNLFGEGFGDYAQGIRMAIYKKHDK
ncbi:MAG: helix-turn-helix domain-containing protein [Lachnospiraceae bacterium]|nr:helix-turn-helix domain-containing protein [Lachnospiraceae bacterium]